MTVKIAVAIVVGLFVVAGGVEAQYGGVGTPPAAQAQDAKASPEKGVKARDLVTSLGGFRGTGNIPIVLTGKVVEIQPGGQTGREQFNVPSFVYVLEGTLTTNSEGGPIGVSGVQYTAAGQSYMDAPGVWHVHSNPGQTPVKYLLLFIGTPGGPVMQKAADD
jgi:quercetin dioxygenase-like cupin family protein